MDVTRMPDSRFAFEKNEPTLSPVYVSPKIAHQRTGSYQTEDRSGLYDIGFC